MTVTLLIVNTLLFLVSCLAYGYPPVFPSHGLWALNLTDGFQHLEIWQFLTYQFFHGGLIHLLLNSWIIYTFGREVEEVIGRRSLLILYLSSGLGGSLAQLGAAAVLPHLFGRIVVGASASGLGLLAAYASLFPERPFTALVLFIVPVCVRAKYLLGIAAGLALFGIAFPADNVAHAAHYGGIFVGMAFARFALRGVPSERPRLPGRNAEQLPQATMTFVTHRPVLRQQAESRSHSKTETTETAERLTQQVDTILDKIHAQGLDSLTIQEREVLERARQQMGKEG